MDNTNNPSRFEFYQKEGVEENIGRAVFFNVLGDALLVIDEISFTKAHNIYEAIQRAERAMRVKTRQDIGTMITDSAYKD